MCNEYEFQLKYDEYVEMMQYVDLGTPSGETAGSMPQLPSVRIGDAAAATLCAICPMASSACR